MPSVYENLRNNKNIDLESIALIYYSKKITYLELFENINAFAKSFRAYGIGVGDNVGIHSEHTPETVYAFFACNMIGACAILIDVTYTIEKVKPILHKYTPKILIVKKNLLVPEYKTYLKCAFYIEQVIVI